MEFFAAFFAAFFWLADQGGGSAIYLLNAEKMLRG